MKIARAMAVMIAAGALPAGAADRWEIRSDNGAFTPNELQPGIAQIGHDLETVAAVPDVDWYKVRTQQRHSYEARVFGGGVIWAYGACPTCAALDRVAGDGSVLTAGDDDGGVGGGGTHSVRWIGNSSFDWLRVLPRDGVGGFANENYDVVLTDTTLFLPRFNNGGSQRTVLILQNTRDRQVGGTIYFYNASGGQLLAHDFTTAAYGTLLLDTASLAPLVGQSGSAQIAHTGGQGAFTGKGVSLEPSTGFTFDTTVTTAPR